MYYYERTEKFYSPRIIVISFDKSTSRRRRKRLTDLCRSPTRGNGQQYNIPSER